MYNFTCFFFSFFAGKQVFIDENLLSQLTNLDKLKTDFQECIDMMKEDFIKNLSLRSSTGEFISNVFKHYFWQDKVVFWNDWRKGKILVTI